MTTLEDKLLGYKAQNYASSSESEREDSGDDEPSEGKAQTSANEDPSNVEEPDFRLNVPKTGPKGVVQDYRRYKQLQAEQREEKKQELVNLARKFATTCQSSLDEAREKKMMEELELEDEEFLKMYHMKRLMEMKAEAEQFVLKNRPKFGTLLKICGSEFVDAVDKERSDVTVIVHLYEENDTTCQVMNGCLACLAKEHPTVKFCKVLASETGISKKFQKQGLPALLVYKDGEVIGNFVRLGDTFGEDFFAVDVESFLVQHGIFPSEAAGAMSAKTMQADDEDEDSD